jgi:hypothetical protein
MAYYYSSNTADINTGHLNLCETNETAPVKIILTPKTAEIATKAAALLKSTWSAALAADRPARWYALPVADQMAAADEEDTPIDRPFKGGKLVIYGDKGFTMDFMTNPYLTHMLASITPSNLACFVVDQNENIKGLSDGTKFLPRAVTSFNVSHPTPAPGEAQVTRIEVKFSNQREYLKKYELVNPAEQSTGAWSARNDLDSVYFVNLTINGVWTATGGSMSIIYAHNGEPVVGLAKEDFVIPGKTVSSISYSATTELYTIVGSGFVTSTCDLVAPNNNSLYPTLLLESSAQMPFTVS